LLGAFAYQEKYPGGAPGQQPNTSPRARYFEQTGHTLGGGFLEYWNSHGGLAQQGYPISDEFTEVSDLDGQPYVVQYFQRVVFEYHPENPPSGRVLLSQLGTFRYREQDVISPWLVPPAQIPPAIGKPEEPPAVKPPPKTLGERIDDYIGKLTLDQQIGQLIMLPINVNTTNGEYRTYTHRYQIANAIMFTANPGSSPPKTLAQLRDITQDLIASSPNPMFIATDEEGGSVDRLAPYYGSSPSPASLAATGDPQRAYAQAKLAAERLKYIGINVDFAPLADVYQGGAIDRSRMFGTTTAQVTRFAGAFLDGLQQNGVVGTLKHWPGLGAASANPDYSPSTINKTRAQLNDTDFAAFRDLLSHDPGMIMATHVMVPAYDTRYPASLSPTLVDGVLREQLGYKGVVVTDAMEAAAVSQYMRSLGYANPATTVGEASVLAILAGEDIVESPGDAASITATVNALKQAVQSGRISQARLKLSLERIIALKVKMGLITLQP
jgi:beta-N-acetylhexosaminidase